jgi:hypothetical protein
MTPQAMTPQAAPARFATVYLIALLLAPLIAVTVPRGLAPLVIACSVIGTVMFRIDHGRWPIPSRRWLLILGGFLAYGALTALWSIRPAQSLRQAFELAYTLVPALLLATAAVRREWGAAVLLPVGMIVLVTGGSSESAMVGLLAGFVTLAVAMVAPVFTRVALGVGLIVTFFGTIPAMKWLYSLDLIDHGHLPFSFLHRIEIWNFASNLVFERPLIGWGLDSSRSIAEKVIVERGGYEFPVLPIHPHNAFLQVWLELGLIGVGFGIAIGLTVLRGIGEMPRQSQPVALAAFAGTMAMISVAYGIWQIWWLGVLFLSMLTIHVLARQHRVG